VAVESTVAVWQIDPKHTFVEFAVSHMMIATVRGRFESVSGTIRADGANPNAATVEVEIDAASLDTHDPRRDAHLRSPDFLDVERYPSIHFRSTGVEQVAPARLRLNGDLTIRGATRPVAIDVAQLGRGRGLDGLEVAAFSGELALDRREFGLVWNATLEAGAVLVGDTVAVRLDLEAIRQD
jgi:polyisoprenoid-binding protein YceI